MVIHRAPGFRERRPTEASCACHVGSSTGVLLLTTGAWGVDKSCCSRHRVGPFESKFKSMIELRGCTAAVRCQLYTNGWIASCHTGATAANPLGPAPQDCLYFPWHPSRNSTRPRREVAWVRPRGGWAVNRRIRNQFRTGDAVRRVLQGGGRRVTVGKSSCAQVQDPGVPRRLLRADRRVQTREQRNATGHHGEAASDTIPGGDIAVLGSYVTYILASRAVCSSTKQPNCTIDLQSTYCYSY